MERRRPRDDLDVALARAQLERDLRRRQRADDVERQPRGQHRGAGAHDLGSERDAEPDLHVRRAQLDATLLRGELDTRERLHRAPRRRHAGDGLQMREQIGARARDLHDENLLLEIGVIGVVDMWRAGSEAR